MRTIPFKLELSIVAAASLLSFATVCIAAETLETRAQTTGRQPMFGTFHSLTLNQAPLPFNPFPDLPATEIKPNVWVYDDRAVDYVQIRTEIAAQKAIMAEEAAMTAEAELAFEGPQSSSLLQASGSSGLMLHIVRTTDNGRRIYFDTQPGIIYTIEQSSDLSTWTVMDRIVADDTTEAFYAFEGDNRFYRVQQGSDLIQFPNFHPTVEQSAFIDVYTPVQGTATVEIYADGNLWYAVQGGIPLSGYFRVSDGLYNPANWPNDGYYSINQWEFRVTVTPTGLAAAAANQGVVFKKGRQRPPLRTGITVYQRAVFPDGFHAATETEFVNFMFSYYLANIQVGNQVDLNGALLNEFIDAESVPAIRSTADVNLLRKRLFNSLEIPSLADVDRLHYFGHGANTGFLGININEVHRKVSCVYPFTFVALDGCNTAQTTDLLGEYTCYWKTTTLNDVRDRGLTPGFGCGWDQKKVISHLVNQGSLLDAHFIFWVDFYGADGGLTHRPPQLPTGYFDRTYQEAHDFAKTPAGLGFSPSINQNAEEKGFVMVGCVDCYFDL